MNCADRVGTFVIIHHNDADWLPSKAAFYES